jgi:hypothetical protein
LTPNRSAGRQDDETWARFLRWARWLGITNTAAFEKLITEHCDVPPGTPIPPGRHRRREYDDPASLAVQ